MHPIDHSLGYARSLYPMCVSISGTRLRPFMVGHALLLTSRNSPIASLWSEKPIGPVSVGDVALAMWVCSQIPTDAFRKLASWTTRWSIKRLGERISKDDPDRTINTFMDYVCRGLTGPRMCVQGETKMVGAPMIAMLHVGLLTHFGRSDAEALNTPLSVAIWQRAVFLEERGFARMWNQEDQEQFEWSEEMAKNPEKVEQMFRDLENNGGPNG